MVPHLRAQIKALNDKWKGKDPDVATTFAALFDDEDIHVSDVYRMFMVHFHDLDLQKEAMDDLFSLLHYSDYPVTQIGFSVSDEKDMNEYFISCLKHSTGTGIKMGIRDCTSRRIIFTETMNPNKIYSSSDKIMASLAEQDAKNICPVIINGFYSTILTIIQSCLNSLKPLSSIPRK